MAHATGAGAVNLDPHRNHWLLFGVASLAFVGLSVLIAVAPAIETERAVAPLPGSAPLTEDQRAGLTIYLAEGCPYCHTQQVRPLPQDKPFGRPSAPGDYARLAPLDAWRHTPAVLGTERTGPDLSDIGRRQPSATWQYMHLYQPRSLVASSVMPAFPWLFRVKPHADATDVTVPVPAKYVAGGGTVVPTPDAQHLVAYLLALEQVPLGPGGG